MIEKNQLKIIINENKKDHCNQANKKKLKENLINRLILDDKKISHIISSIKTDNQA